MRALAGAGRVRHSAHWAVVVTFGTIFGTNIVNNGLGVVYWWIAAHRYTPSAVGLAAAAISAMNLLGMLGMLGIGTLLMGELPRRPDQRGGLLLAGLLSVMGAGLVLGLAFAIVAASFSSALRPIASSAGTLALFACGTGLTSLTLVLDQALVGLMRGPLQLLRNAVFGIAKLAALAIAGIWLLHGGGSTIVATWIAGYVVSLALLLRMVGGTRRLLSPRFALLRSLGWQAVGHHVLNVALQLQGLLMPLVVAVMLSVTATAYFNMAGLVSTLVYVLPSALATVLFAAASAEPASLPHRLRFSLGLSLVLTCIANLLLLVTAGPILGVFGSSYASNGAIPLVLFSLGAIPMTIREHYATIQRLKGRPLGAAPIVLAGALARIVLGAEGARLDGLTGLGIGLLITGCVEALVLAPVVLPVAFGATIARSATRTSTFAKAPGATAD